MATEYSFDEMDWEEYVKYRPEYPQKLYDIVYDHHKSHGGKFDTALDVGGGVGIVSRQLLKTFRQVILSDPSELYISQGKAYFSNDADASSRLTYLVSKLEDMKLTNMPGAKQVDLIASGEALHWADVERCTHAAAGLLHPGGTFSCWLYFPKPKWPAGNAAAEAHERVWKKYKSLYNDMVQRVPEEGYLVTMDSRLDDMPFDPAVWKDVRRLKVHEEDAVLSTLYTSKVREDVEKQERLGEGFISRDADFEWVQGYYQNLVPLLKMTESAAGEFGELKKAMMGTSVKLDWPTVLVVATRR